MKSLWARFRALYYRTLVRIVRRHPGLLVLDKGSFDSAFERVLRLELYVQTSGHMNTLKGRTPKARKRLGRGLHDIAVMLHTATRVQP